MIRLLKKTAALSIMIPMGLLVCFWAVAIWILVTVFDVLGWAFDEAFLK